MSKKAKIKKFVNDHEAEILGAVCSAIGIITYTYTCRKLGYEMVKPLGVKDDHFYVKTINGKLLKAPLPIN